jgi:hypothetical protein
MPATFYARPAALYAAEGVKRCSNFDPGNGDGSLTITAPPESSTGQIQSGTLQRSDPNSYNQAVEALNSTIAQDSNQAAQAQMQQHSQDQQTAAGDTNSLGVRYTLEQGIG